mmetsp:Transcript_62135/g.122041  ORF Transcript_62135/g.122041 Transcript_62135/m.122041 type:complete len:358 (-) Transcript_62135:161-1234(-)
MMNKMMRVTMLASSLFRVCLSQEPGGSALSLPVDIVSVPLECETLSSVGDHLLVRYSLLNAANLDAVPIFFVMSWEQQHFELGHADTPSAFNEGLLGMCAGEKRRLTFPSKEFDMGAAEQERAPVVVSEVELVTLTTQGDFHIFNLLRSGDMPALMEMIDHEAGVNAVDALGNSALMAAVQKVGSGGSGADMAQMAVATLLNAWRPKCDVGFAKPSGHTVLFYAATQDDTQGGTHILKALLKRGADPNASLMQPGMTLGWTPLHFACKTANIKHVGMLLDYGADPLAETAAGESVLDVAKDASYSVRKKLAALLNDALERLEDEDGGESAEAAIEAPAGDEGSKGSEGGGGTWGMEL